MKKNFIISSVLALAMGIAQAQTMPQTQPVPMQSGTGDPQRGAGQTQIPPAAAQAPGAPTSTETAAQTFKGCLNGSPGGWNLISDKGKTLTLSGTDDKLSQYKGQEVRIQGVQATDGSVTVSSIDQISGSCPNQAASNSTSQNDLSSQSATSTQPPSSAENQAPATTTTSETSNQSSSTTATTTPGANTPPVTNETPANTVGNGQTGQNSAGSIAGNAAATGTEQNANNQGVKQYSDMDQNTSQKLPQTASPLPLLGLLGLGSLAAGLISRRRK
jgi:hypothetical protein